MDHELRFERVFDAAPGEVFDAFTDPEGLEEMYGLEEPGWIVESEGAISVGSAWTVAFGPSRGELSRFTHVFRVVDRPRRVGFTSTEVAPDGTGFDSEVEVTFEERDTGTVVTIVQRGFPSAAVRDSHLVGLPRAFGRVERVVRSRATGATAPGGYTDEGR